MILTDLWERSRDELLQKQLHQIIAIAGQGKLRDGSTASIEFRRFLSHVPSDRLRAYADEGLAKGARSYWFAFHPHQRQWLGQSKAAYLALGCGSAKQTMLVPFSAVEALLPDMWTTTRGDRTYWHIRLNVSGKTYTLSLRKGTKNPDMTRFLLHSGVLEPT